MVVLQQLRCHRLGFLHAHLMILISSSPKAAGDSSNEAVHASAAA